MRVLPQESHPDLGLWPEQDQTEDLRESRKAPVAASALQNELPNPTI
ncbi:hypothetical protein [Mycolicibacterium fortuitum]